MLNFCFCVGCVLINLLPECKNNYLSVFSLQTTGMETQKAKWFPALERVRRRWNQGMKRVGRDRLSPSTPTASPVRQPPKGNPAIRPSRQDFTLREWIVHKLDVFTYLRLSKQASVRKSTSVQEHWNHRVNHVCGASWNQSYRRATTTSGLLRRPRSHTGQW